MTTMLLKTAVYQSRAASKKGLLERLFAVWFQRLVYNQIWEDPAVDLEALRIGPSSRVITIASGQIRKDFVNFSSARWSRERTLRFSRVMNATAT